MPVFPQHNALFIHIPKNAGRSIETALFPEGVTSISGRRSVPNRAAHYVQTLTANPVAKPYLVGTRDVSLSGQHLTLAEIELLGLIPADQLSAAFTFCVVRNPYERAISSILHFRKRFSAAYTLDAKPSAGQIERALEVWAGIEPDDHNLRAHRRPQADFVFTRNHANAMDMVLRFERLNEDFKALKIALGATTAVLPWIGKSSTAHTDYAALFSPRARALVEDMYHCDLDLFGYGYPA